ncbi:hypothetical protein [Iodobacter sp.]|nr:hypothetical protein [Iodobacter sp.]
MRRIHIVNTSLKALLFADLQAAKPTVNQAMQNQRLEQGWDE